MQIQGLGFNEGLKGFINVQQGVPQRIPEGLSKGFFTALGENDEIKRKGKHNARLNTTRLNSPKPYLQE